MSDLDDADMILVLRNHIRRTHRTQNIAARAWGVTPAFVSMILNGHKAATDAILAEAGLERVVTYRRKKSR